MTTAKFLLLARPLATRTSGHDDERGNADCRAEALRPSQIPTVGTQQSTHVVVPGVNDVHVTVELELIQICLPFTTQSSPLLSREGGPHIASLLDLAVIPIQDLAAANK